MSANFARTRTAARSCAPRPWGKVARRRCAYSTAGRLVVEEVGVGES